MPCLGRHSQFYYILFRTKDKMHVVFLKKIHFRDGPLEKWWGGGWGIFSLHEFFFFRSLLVQDFFFRWTPLHEFFFQTNIASFWTVKFWFIIYVFVLYKLFYTHNRSKDTGHFNAKSFRKCTLSERGGSHLEWTASLCIFAVPALWNSSPTAHLNDAMLHSPKQPLCSALHSKMSIQKEDSCLVKVKY